MKHFGGLALLANGTLEIKAPWWVQAIGVIGVTAAIALYLVYWVTTSVSVQLGVIASAVTEDTRMSAEILKLAQTEQMQVAADRSESDRATLVFRHQELNLVMQSCVNAAKSPYQVQQCKDRMGGTEYIP